MLEDILFFTLYGSVTFAAMIACHYLLLRRDNIFEPEVNSPVRLRRWTAAFFAAMAASHVWWLLLYYLQPSDDFSIRVTICVVLDTVVALPTVLCTMLVMLQDRRRSLWPVAVAVVLSLSSLVIARISGNNYSTFEMLIYFLPTLFIIVMMALGVREYGNWLRDNYSDLEHKEVWQNFLLLVVFVLISIVYSFGSLTIVTDIFLQVLDIILIFLMLWRVETLQALDESGVELMKKSGPGDPIFDEIELLLQRHCIDSQYYLRHNVSLSQLANHIGISSLYLSQHFAQLGMTYNTYINSLRIEHFIRIYQETAKTKSDVSVTELAGKCGFQSDNTFSTAFKKIKGQTVKEWLLSQHD